MITLILAVAAAPVQLNATVIERPVAVQSGAAAASAAARKQQMIADGATILDIGGQSTRPGSERISTAEELKRVIPVIEAISKKFPGTIISIDTYSSEVAAAAVEAVRGRYGARA